MILWSTFWLIPCDFKGRVESLNSFQEIPCNSLIEPGRGMTVIGNQKAFTVFGNVAIHIQNVDPVFIQTISQWTFKVAAGVDIDAEFSPGELSDKLIF